MRCHALFVLSHCKYCPLVQPVWAVPDVPRYTFEDNVVLPVTDNVLFNTDAPVTSNEFNVALPLVVSVVIPDNAWAAELYCTWVVPIYIDGKSPLAIVPHEGVLEVIVKNFLVVVVFAASFASVLAADA